jgi:addiction module HigA family antidote
MNMHNPPHPGEVLREMWLVPIGISITEAAKRLGISRKALSELVNGHTSVSPQMAVRLSVALKTSAKVWMNMQTNYDLWHVEKDRKRLKVQVFA